MRVTGPATAPLVAVLCSGEDTRQTRRRDVTIQHTRPKHNITYYYLILVGRVIDRLCACQDTRAALRHEGLCLESRRSFRSETRGSLPGVSQVLLLTHIEDSLMFNVKPPSKICQKYQYQVRTRE